MRRGARRVLLAALAIAGCERTPSAERRVADEPRPTSPPGPPGAAVGRAGRLVPVAPVVPVDEYGQAPRDRDHQPVACGKGPAPTTDWPGRLGSQVDIINDDLPLQWSDGATGRWYELGTAPTVAFVDRGPGDQVEGRTWDERNWYRLTCIGDCRPESSHGVALAVVAIDRKTGAETRLTSGDRAFGDGGGDLLAYGDHVYWGTYPHDSGGGVYRVAKAGGAPETVWEGGAIDRLLAFPDGILAIAGWSLIWIPRDGGKPTEVVRVGWEISAVATDGDAWFFAERGDRFWQSADSGSIYRVPRAGGAPTRLLGPIRWPTALAVRGDRLYYMIEDSDAVWSIAKTGGPPTIVIPEDPQLAARPCLSTLALWVDERGLFRYRGRPYERDGVNVLTFTPWP